MIEETKSLISKPVRLSEAYPPDTVNNSQFLAGCHYFLKGYDVSRIKPEDVLLRPIKYKKDLE
jgi:hypothetical protein